MESSSPGHHRNPRSSSLKVKSQSQSTRHQDNRSGSDDDSSTELINRDHNSSQLSGHHNDVQVKTSVTINEPPVIFRIDSTDEMERMSY